MRYYLETNAIVTLRNRLNTINLTNCFTSFLTLYELIKNCAVVEEYEQATKSISNIINYKLPVNGDLPEFLLLKNFGLNKYCDDLDLGQNNLNEICEAIHKSRSQEKFLTFIDVNKTLKVDFFRISDYCKQLSNLFGEIQDGSLEHYSQIERIEKIQKNTYNYNDILFEHSCGRHTKLTDLVKKFCNSDTVDTAFLLANDKGLIDTFIKGYSAYFIYCSIYGASKAHKNTWADLNHLFYVNTDVTIVSDDKIYKKIKIIYPNLKVIGVGEFEKANQKS